MSRTVRVFGVYDKRKGKENGITPWTFAKRKDIVDAFDRIGPEAKIEIS